MLQCTYAIVIEKPVGRDAISAVGEYDDNLLGILLALWRKDSPDCTVVSVVVGCDEYLEGVASQVGLSKLDQLCLAGVLANSNRRCNLMTIINGPEICQQC